MKVSERIGLIREDVERCRLSLVDDTVIMSQLIQLEVEIVDALQVARHEGYRAGYRIGFVEGRIIERG